MKKTKITLKKMNGMIVIVNEQTTILGFKSWAEGRKFLKIIKQINKKNGKTK